MDAQRVTIVGASGRAAAAGARRAGLVPSVVDLFADRETRLLAETIRCPLADYPEALPDLVRRLPPGPVAYTGGLENHPDVLDRLCTERTLWGNGREAVESVRDTVLLRERLAGTGLHFPRHFPDPPAGIDYLVKRRASSGGLGVRRASVGRKPPVEPPAIADSTGSLRPPFAGNDEYLEEFIPGRLLSAQFRDDTLLGVTEQLSGEHWLHTPAFHYAGNIGPVEIPPELSRTFANTARRLSLRGPWGIDFIRNDTGAYVLEVNPRYTAAIEVLELQCQRALSFSREAQTIADAALVCASRLNGRVVGKSIYFSPGLFRFPPSGPWDVDLESPWNPWRIPGFADIPHPGEPFRPGQPVLTFFAVDSTPEAVRAKLMTTARDLDALFREANQ